MSNVDGVTSPEPGFRHWKSLGDGFLLSLLIVGPTFLFEELWRGKPMIDQGGGWWLVPTGIMAIGFFVGGRVAGRNRRARKSAFNQGMVTAALTLVLIFVADIIRRTVLEKGFPPGVMRLWVVSALLALLVGGLGAINGRRGNIRARHRHQMERFH
jgi:hypothetical protein